MREKIYLGKKQAERKFLLSLTVFLTSLVAVGMVNQSRELIITTNMLTLSITLMLWVILQLTILLICCKSSLICACLAKQYGWSKGIAGLFNRNF